MANERRGSGSGGAPRGTEIVPASTTVSAFLEKNKGQILRVIPRHMDPERLLRVAISCIARSDKLQKATLESLVRGIVASAVLGLELDVNGEAYLLPFKSSFLSQQHQREVYEAVFVTGYKGYIKLARQSREVESIHTGVYYDGDTFDFDEGDRAFVRHKRRLRPVSELAAYLASNEPPPRALAYYVATRMRGAHFPQVRVLDPFEVEQARLRSRARDSGPWVTDYDAMGLKTAIRRAAKTWPSGLNPNLTRAIVAEDRFEEHGPSMPIGDVFPELEALNIGSGSTQALDGETAKQNPTSRAVEEALGAKPKDDVPFETAEEEKARKERERKPREPGQEG